MFSPAEFLSLIVFVLAEFELVGHGPAPARRPEVGPKRRQQQRRQGDHGGQYFGRFGRKFGQNIGNFGRFFWQKTSTIFGNFLSKPKL
jgi:hypothetical protein